MQREIWSLEFVQVVNFKLIDSLKNNGTKYLLISDNSFEEICNPKAFVDNACAERHRGLSTIYIKHNSFQQSKLGQEFELQIPHNDHFKPHLDVTQVSTPNAQLGIGSELLDWY